MSTTVWPAPAKLNLFLHVLRRRDDGYHDLQTVFQFIDLEDRISLYVRPDGRVRRTSAHAQVDEDADLVVRAAHLLKQETGTSLGADISVDKRIPLGAGLGGGSSDAATTLLGLNKVWNLGLGSDDLAALGLRLGADVPVFVQGLAAWAEGVGERLQPVELETPWYLVINPGCSVSTQSVFSHPALTRDSAALRIRDFLPPGGGQVLSLRALRLRGGGAGALPGGGRGVALAFPLRRCAHDRYRGERVRALLRARAGATVVAKPARRLERLRCQGNEPLGRSRVSVKFRAEGAGGERHVGA
jgi:4-diphosphocytidyl-2-C-methyl-D-erythritol kinase